MMFKCPYCGRTFEPHGRSHCPHCGKVMHVPSWLRREPAGPASRRPGPPADLAAEPAARPRPHRVRRTAVASSLPFWQRLLRSPRAVIWVVGGTIILLALVARQSGLSLNEVIARWTGSRMPDAAGPAEEAVGRLGVLRMGLEMFRADCGRYPTTQETLCALLANPGARGWKGPYVRKLWPDPWQRPYAYALSNGVARLSSGGPDRVHGTADDILAPPLEPGWTGDPLGD
jgi:general secretion pathway protein G